MITGIMPVLGGLEALLVNVLIGSVPRDCEYSSLMAQVIFVLVVAAWAAAITAVVRFYRRRLGRP